MHSILVYHSVSSAVEPLPGHIDISPERFKKQMQWLSRWRNVVRLFQTLRAPASERLVSITFDNGYRDNLTTALPILEKFDFPMTLFVAPGLLGKKGYLSHDELREISRHPLVTIGAHGLHNRRFTELNRNDSRFELIESRIILEKITKKRVELMSWPDGVCNEELERLSDAAGYRASWSEWNGENTIHSLKRITLYREDNMPRFIAKVTGAYFPLKSFQGKLAKLKVRASRRHVARPPHTHPGEVQH
jgi:peptidoglycan/xylan/chitin deacetylase (PgdA/CDA1 family)